MKGHYLFNIRIESGPSITPKNTWQLFPYVSPFHNKFTALNFNDSSTKTMQFPNIMPRARSSLQLNSTISCPIAQVGSVIKFARNGLVFIVLGHKK